MMQRLIRGHVYPSGQWQPGAVSGPRVIAEGYEVGEALRAARGEAPRKRPFVRWELQHRDGGQWVTVEAFHGTAR